MMDVAKELESRLMPMLEVAASTLRSEFPTANIRTESHPVGSLTDLQGHYVAISCLLVEPDSRVTEMKRTQPDLVDLVIGVQHLTTEPELSELYVCWGHPSGHIELELLHAPIPINEAAWGRAVDSVAPLVDALRTAIRRGQPPEWAAPGFPG